MNHQRHSSLDQPLAQHMPPVFSENVTAEPVGLPRHEPLGGDARVPVEMLASEYLDALRIGKSPALEEYIARFPEHAEELRSLLPLVAAMEDWKADKQHESTPRIVPQNFNIQRLGDCRIIREIGRGGMGVVFEAIQEPLGRRVAVKLLPWRFGRDALWRGRFQREARLAASLRHANIVPVFRFGEYEGFCYYVMPFIVGMGLDWVIERLAGGGAIDARGIEQTRMGTGVRGEESAESEDDHRSTTGRSPVRTPDTADAEELSHHAERQLAAGSWKKIAKIGVQAAAALRYAHGRGLLHRDIKPGNLLLDTSGTVWITDFGLAQPIEQIGQTQSIAGTLRYMPPEQLEGRADERSDIYSLGVTLYELVTLQQAFAADSRAELMRAIRTGTLRPVRDACPGIPRALAEIIGRCTAADPEARFRSADELTSAMLAYLNRTPHRETPRSWIGRLWTRWPW